MPIPLALIAGGMALAGAGVTAGSQAKLNKKNREWQDENWVKQTQWNEDMWNKQNQYDQEQWEKQNEYNEGLWNKQNEYNERMWQRDNQYNEQRWNIENQYNSPMEQMKRFKEAGLNPNLIYGQQSQGGSISAGNQDTPMQSPVTQKGSSASSAGTGSWNPQNPNFDLSNGLLAYNNFKEQAARTNNLEAQNNLIGAQVVDTLAKTKKTGVETDNMEKLIDHQVQALEANIQKTTVETDLALKRNEREAALNSSNLREAAQRIGNMRSERINKEMDTELKMLDYNLRRMGVNPNDPTWMRVLGQLINKYWGDALEFGKKYLDAMKN